MRWTQLPTHKGDRDCLRPTGCKQTSRSLHSRPSVCCTSHKHTQNTYISRCILSALTRVKRKNRYKLTGITTWIYSVPTSTPPLPRLIKEGNITLNYLTVYGGISLTFLHVTIYILLVHFYRTVPWTLYLKLCTTSQKHHHHKHTIITKQNLYKIQTTASLRDYYEASFVLFVMVKLITKLASKKTLNYRIIMDSVPCLLIKLLDTHIHR